MRTGGVLMQTAWKPAPGQVALIEPAGTDGGCLTGVVVGDSEHVIIDLGASPGPPTADCEVVASFFAPDALYRMRATAHPRAGKASVIDLSVHGVERVQRRTVPRARVALPVVLSNLDEPGDLASVVGETIDLGTGGCRVLTERPYPLGGDPTVTIDLPGGQRVVGLAAVLQSVRGDRGWEYRLVFLDLSDDDRALLTDVVRQAAGDGRAEGGARQESA